MATQSHPTKERKDLDRVTIRFAGDSGDGMQLVGNQFTNSSAISGNDVSTFPDFPAEIRAPQGSLPGVSAFQLSFASEDIFTPGDRPDVLVAMNPAALKVNLADLPKGGALIVNSDEFTPMNLKKAGYEHNPLQDGSLAGYHLFEVPITKLNKLALTESGLTAQQVERCKNYFALGLMCWLYDRPLDPTLRDLEHKFREKEAIREANKKTLHAGYAFGETAELFHERYRVPPAKLQPGVYRNINGNTAVALGFLAASQQSGLPLFYGGYPITPASDVLHELARFKSFGVRTFQAEDEIAAIGSAVGAAYGGALAITASSGPGICLKAEGIGMAVMTELPLVIIDVQRAGPSTGMPTKPEQGDLLLAMFGRNSESPAVIVAPATPGDCFDMALEAARLAVKYMTPVFYLSDAYLANGTEPWRIPRIEDLPKIVIEKRTSPENFLPYARHETTLARPWAVPGTPNLEHRIGTLEKADKTGNVCYDPANHQRMTDLRAMKIAGIASDIPELEIYGQDRGDVLVVGWGSTFGAIRSAVQKHQREGRAVSHAHVRYLNPLPRNIEAVMRRFKTVLVPELNCGQLQMLLRSRFLIDVKGQHKVTGQPFRIVEIYDAINELLTTAHKPGN